MVSSDNEKLFVRLRRGVRIDCVKNQLRLIGDRGDVSEVQVQELRGDDLRSLTGEGLECTTLLRGKNERGCEDAKVTARVEGLIPQAFVEYVWYTDDVQRAVVSDLSPNFAFKVSPLPLGAPLVLSRFAYAHRVGTTLAVDSPEASCRLQLSCLELAHPFAQLARSCCVGAPHRGQKRLLELASLMWATGFLEVASAPEPFQRSCWEFQDLLFHWGTREGRVSGAQGGTHRFLGVSPAPPAIKPPMSCHRVSLPAAADIIGPTRSRGLTEIMESRRSRRLQGTEPIGVAQIARLMCHSLRVQQRLTGDYQELLLRPVPAAGAIHEIEAYLVVGACRDLMRGMYQYHPEEHALYRLPTAEGDVGLLLDNAALAWGRPNDPPQVLVILASRMPRIAWKYEGIAYRLSLLNAGAILQALYLLATEMGLACSALGGGDSSVFAAATGLDPFTETSIAEFGVGSAADSSLI